MKASVLAGLNILIPGKPGTGKTQAMKDIYRGYFGGNKIDGGQGVLIRGNDPELDVHNEIFRELNIDKGRRELTHSVEALIYALDEINRTPAVAQNQFLSLGDGDFNDRGREIKLGREGYHILIATANLGNGEHLGTFEMDSALYNRLHVVLDLDNPDYEPTNQDVFQKQKREQNPNVKGAPIKDISAKIIETSKKIREMTQNPSLEEIALRNYLEIGLKNCMLSSDENGAGRKGKVWPLKCQDCKYNAGTSKAICSLINSPNDRTTQAMSKYAAALYFLAKLKDPDVKIDTTELMFKSFELTGAYQLLLNPQELRGRFQGQNPVFMKNVVNRLREEYKKDEDKILASLESARGGKSLTVLFEHEGQIGNYDELSDKAKEHTLALKPYMDKREVGLSWVEEKIRDIIDETKNEIKEGV